MINQCINFNRNCKNLNSLSSNKNKKKNYLFNNKILRVKLLKVWTQPASWTNIQKNSLHWPNCTWNKDVKWRCPHLRTQPANLLTLANTTLNLSNCVRWSKLCTKSFQLIKMTIVCWCLWQTILIWRLRRTLGPRSAKWRTTPARPDSSPISICWTSWTVSINKRTKLKRF